MKTPDFRALCAELVYELDAETGYTRRDGQRTTNPAVVRARTALAEPMLPAHRCTGCGSSRVVAIRAVAGGAIACCPDCSTLTVADRNEIRRVALAVEAVGPSDAELERFAEDTWIPYAKVQPNPQGRSWDLVLSRAVLARYGTTTPRPVPVAERLPGARDILFEFSVFDADYEEQAGGSAPTYAQVLSEGQHYLAQYQQDGPHTLELRRVEVMDPDALPTPAQEGADD